MGFQTSVLFDNLEFMKQNKSVSFDYHLIYEFKNIRLTVLRGNDICILNFNIK